MTSSDLIKHSLILSFSTSGEFKKIRQNLFSNINLDFLNNIFKKYDEIHYLQIQLLNQFFMIIYK